MKKQVYFCGRIWEIKWCRQAFLWGQRVKTRRRLQGRNATLGTSPVLWTNGPSCNSKLDFVQVFSAIKHLGVSLPTTLPCTWEQQIPSLPAVSTQGKAGRVGSGGNRPAHGSTLLLAVPSWCGSLYPGHPAPCCLAPLSNGFLSSFHFPGGEWACAAFVLPVR